MSAELDLISEQDATIERLSAELDSIMGKWEAAKRVAEFFSEECKTLNARADKAEAALAKARELLQRVVDAQAKHYGDGSSLHLEMIDLAATIRTTLAEGE